MKILVVHAHTANRGDEAAVRAMVDELLLSLPNAEIVICINGNTFYPNMPAGVKQIGRVPKLHSKLSLLQFYLLYFSNGKIAFGREIKEFIDLLKSADIVIHAPGGPSIGDIYISVEKLYLMRLDLARKLKIPYMFYAPSMGPFKKSKHAKLRKKVICGAKKIILRDPISINYLRDFIPGIVVEHALDSALQHDVDEINNQIKLEQYLELTSFLDNHKKCVGITITDLKWHPKYKNTDISNVIGTSFNGLIDELINKGYGVVFIPQLYGANNDTVVMNEYMRSVHTFMIDANNTEYDSYFQQYVIGKMYAVVGMRYHSNIFSAKMSTPFVSVSYEQKMEGFMDSLGLNNYCIKIDNLSKDGLLEKVNYLIDNSEKYKLVLQNKHEEIKKLSRKSTDAVLQILKGDLK